ncbi:decaprenyl-phosphate phosphoribosyltransferase [Granulicoccus phenolivorans]|uniref:decaprenyl-phosphate phosphoribosyltransferase n=1 Tax=Granulicoccus phenolivorans TaxID=266854 RepID=UPI0009DC0FA3|nr:decaprenyl-phosphate phosphoribosyltransferase [Granulicoccus phenolivorans]
MSTNAEGPASASSAPSVPAEAPPNHRLPAWLRAMRPRQWVKNVLVFAAPLTAGRILEPAVLIPAVLAFVAFCLISATIYLLNDAKDVAEDRLHPRKRYRPIAAGELKLPVAYAMAVVCCAAGLVLGFWVARDLGTVLSVYLILQLLYTQFLKHQPIIDLAMVASGFLLRMMAGGAATHIPLSAWFLLVAAFGSLFMVAGKRYSELVVLGADAGTRKSLKAYTVSYLRFAWHLSAAITVMSYCLWAIGGPLPQGQPIGSGGLWGLPWATLSIIPFVLGLLQYALEVDRGDAGEPEDVVLNHRPLQISGLLWLLCIVAMFF